MFWNGTDQNAGEGDPWGRAVPVLRLSEIKQKFFVRESGLFDDGFQSPPLKIAIVEWNRDTQGGVAGMLEDVVTAADVVDEKTSPLQSPEHRARLEGRQPHCHLG